MNKGPCKDCDDRTVTPNCHTHCAGYKRWKAEQRKAHVREREFLIQFHDEQKSNHAEFGRRKA